MAKMSQKKLLEEGFGSFLRRNIARAARGAGAVGGAIKGASDAGVRAGVSDIVKGAKAGYETEKSKQKQKKSELDDTIEELGYIRIGTPRGKGDVIVIPVAELDYDEETGDQIEGSKYLRPLILKWDKDDRAFSVVRSPKMSSSNKKEKDKEQEANTDSETFNTGTTTTISTQVPSGGDPPTTITSSYSQKDLLQQLTLISD